MPTYVVHFETLEGPGVCFSPRLSDARKMAAYAKDNGSKCRIFRLGNEVKADGAQNPSIVYLNCPFDEKDEAKALGAWWDPDVKKWYVPEHLSVVDFQKWLPDFTLQARTVLTAEAASTDDFQVIDLDDVRAMQA